MVEDVLRHADAEPFFERERQLHEVKRIGCQIVAERDFRYELFDAHAEMIDHKAPDVGLHELIHAPPPQDRGEHRR